MDGTLVGSSDAVNVVWKEWAASVGVRAGMTIVEVATTHPASALGTPHVIPDLSAVTVLSCPVGTTRRLSNFFSSG
jgi:hypothetical protein